MDPSTLSAWAASVSAITTIILAWMTGRYVRLTGRMVAEMRAARQPIVFIDLEIIEGSEVVLLIGNSGDAPARHVRFEIDDGIPWSQSLWPKPSALPALRDGIPYLAPGRVLRFRVGSLDWKRATGDGGWLNVKISFEGEEGRKFLHPANIDLRRYSGLSTDTFHNYQEQLVDTLQGILRVNMEVADRGSVSMTMHRWCPACARPIPSSAKKCFECGEWLDSSNRQDPPSSDTSAPAT